MTSNDGTALGFLGREIRRARTDKGMSRASLGKAITMSASSVNAWERGDQPPRPEHLKQLTEHLTFDGAAIVMRILAELVSAEVSPEWTGKWLAIEEQAHTLLASEHSVIPGLLQTKDYACALFQQHSSYVDVNQRVAERLDRQKKILDSEDPPMAVFLINEQVIRTLVGTSAAMKEQCTHLLNLMERPNVYIQIVPPKPGYHPGLDGAFMIAKFDGKEVAYQAGLLRGSVIEDESGVSTVYRIWQSIQTRALTEQASRELIVKVEEEWAAA